MTCTMKVKYWSCRTGMVAHIENNRHCSTVRKRERTVACRSASRSLSPATTFKRSRLILTQQRNSKSLQSLRNLEKQFRKCRAGVSHHLQPEVSPCVGPGSGRSKGRRARHTAVWWRRRLCTGSLWQHTHTHKCTDLNKETSPPWRVKCLIFGHFDLDMKWLHCLSLPLHPWASHWAEVTCTPRPAHWPFSFFIGFLEDANSQPSTETCYQAGWNIPIVMLYKNNSMHRIKCINCASKSDYTQVNKSKMGQIGHFRVFDSISRSPKMKQVS